MIKPQSGILFQNDVTLIRFEIEQNSLVLFFNKSGTYNWTICVPGDPSDPKTPAGIVLACLKSFFGRESRMDDLLDALKINQKYLLEFLNNQLKK